MCGDSLEKKVENRSLWSAASHSPGHVAEESKGRAMMLFTMVSLGQIMNAPHKAQLPWAVGHLGAQDAIKVLLESRGADDSHFLWK